MPWIRVNTDLEMDRRFVNLDGFGRAVIQFLWRLAKKNEGLIKNEDLDIDYICNMTGFASNKVDIERQMEKIKSTGSLERFEDGNDWFVPNWDKYQQPKDRTNAERQRRFREKKKLENNGTATENNGTVTPLRNGKVTRNTVHDMTVQDNTIHKEKNIKKESQREKDFARFWEVYPKKTGKAASKKAFLKIKDYPGIEKIVETLEVFKKSGQWTKNNGQYVPNPLTWINQGRWDDEIQDRNPQLRMPQTQTQNPNAPGYRAPAFKFD